MTLAAASELEQEILRHPALSHPFLLGFSQAKPSRPQLQAFGLQHYQLVRVFTTYMTNIIARRPEWLSGLRAILDDEFGQYTIFRSHVHLYRNFLKALGLRDEDWGKVAWAPETKAFIDGHLELTRSGDVMTALGAIGPGHEFSIPTMFSFLLEGLRRDGALSEDDLEYFVLHIEEDKDHAAAFNALIERWAGGPDDLERVRRGALYSLELRRGFWDGCGRLAFGRREDL